MQTFDFLGYTFRPRRSKNRTGKYFVNFTPAVSNKAAKSMRQTMRRWAFQNRSDKSLEDIAHMFNPVSAGLDQLLWALLQVGALPDTPAL